MPLESGRPGRGGPDFGIESVLWRGGHAAIAGVDEAGRGCLAGPVVAAAVILDPDRDVDGLDDSKRLSPTARTRLAALIRERAVAVSVGRSSPAEIDRRNILQASLEAMRRAVDGLGVAASFVLVDGDRMWPRPTIPWRTVVKGDATSRSIAAASIIAKTERDLEMERLAERHPGYGWERNRGYPTPDHFEALRLLGPSPEHRRSFRLRTGELQLFPGP